MELTVFVTAVASPSTGVDSRRFRTPSCALSASEKKNGGSERGSDTTDRTETCSPEGPNRSISATEGSIATNQGKATLGGRREHAGWLGVVSVAAGAAVLDQLTKAWARRYLSEQSISIVPGVFRLELVFNPGAAFGILRGWRWMLLAASPVILAALFAWTRNATAAQRFATGLIVGGIVGNSIDRIFQPQGLVTDFLAPSFWPAFNLADSFMVCGTLVLAFAYLRHGYAARRGDPEKSSRRA
jgi:signal peptidase II